MLYPSAVYKQVLNFDKLENGDPLGKLPPPLPLDDFVLFCNMDRLKENFDPNTQTTQQTGEAWDPDLRYILAMDDNYRHCKDPNSKGGLEARTFNGYQRDPPYGGGIQVCEWFLNSFAQAKYKTWDEVKPETWSKPLGKIQRAVEFSDKEEIDYAALLDLTMLRMLFRLPLPSAFSHKSGLSLGRLEHF